MTLAVSSDDEETRQQRGERLIASWFSVVSRNDRPFQQVICAAVTSYFGQVGQESSGGDGCRTCGHSAHGKKVHSNAECFTDVCSNSSNSTVVVVVVVVVAVVVVVLVAGAQAQLQRLYCCEAQEKQHATLNERLLFHGTSYETAVKIALEG